MYATRDGKPIEDLQRRGDRGARGRRAPEDRGLRARQGPHRPVRRSSASSRTRSNESRQMAADPRARVFVIFLDTYHTQIEGSANMRLPLDQLPRPGARARRPRGGDDAGDGGHRDHLRPQDHRDLQHDAGRVVLGAARTYRRARTTTRRRISTRPAIRRSKRRRTSPRDEGAPAREADARRARGSDGAPRRHPRGAQGGAGGDRRLAPLSSDNRPRTEPPGTAGTSDRATF